MQEKDMVNDVLSMVNSSLTGYANVISQTANQNLRQTLRQIRNSDEDFQFRLAQTATQRVITTRPSRLLRPISVPSGPS